VAAIVNAISAEPSMGDVMAGTGGARKIRFPGRAKGKRGGYRVVTYFAGKDSVPARAVQQKRAGQPIEGRAE